MDRGTVLVTGATGFVGGHLVERLLAAGRHVRVTVRATSNLRWLAGKEIERVEADLRDPESLRRAVAGATAVVHFGGKIKARSRAEFFAANAAGTRALADAFAAQAPPDGSGVFLYCSSLAAGGPAPEVDRVPFRHVREDDPPRPVSPYGESKLQGERELEPLADRVRVVVLRPPAVYGPRDEATLRFFRWVRQGWIPLPRPKGTTFSLIHVRDLTEGTVRALDHPQARGVYYLSDGASHTYEEVGGAAARILGVQVRTVRLPMPLIVVGAAASMLAARLTGTAPLLSLGKIQELRQKCWVCLPARAQGTFGFAPRVPLEEGLEETIRWYQSVGWLPAGR